MKKYIFLLILGLSFLIYFLCKKYVENYEPLVSAICITRKRPSFLKKAIQDFLAQTYSNTELVIVYDVDDFETLKVVKTFTSPKIRLVANNTKNKLGSLRNLGIQHARGEYIIQWDDDDRYHKDRIKRQLREVMKRNPHQACCLKNWIIYDDFTGKRYLSWSRLWEGSILAPTSLMRKYPYPDMALGEDTSVVGKLNAKGMVFAMDAPELYEYHLHGTNSWDYSHGRGLISRSKPISG